MPREAPVTSARVPGVSCMGAEPITMDRMATDHATVAEEEYLQTLFWLQEAGLPMTGANVARAMQLSPPTVHEMIGRLERDGYITRAGDKTISFTDTGAEHAEGIVRRHRLIERFLTDVLGIPWDEVHEEAERLEHAMSPVLEERMLAAIGDAKTCPHGHPIVAGTRIEGVPLADVAEGASVKVLRFENEAEDLLHYLKDAGLEPGPRGRPLQRGDGDEVVLDAGGRERARHAHRRRDRLGRRRPVAAAAGRAARAARARARPLRALAPLVDLQGRVAIVTGGAAGAGATMVKRLAGEGVTVVIADVDGPRRSRGRRGDRRGRRRGSFVRADVRVTGDVEHMVGVAEERHGGVDILVNNAGGWGPTANYPPPRCSGARRWTSTCARRCSPRSSCSSRCAGAAAAR